ncbi:hypothetical protein AKJ09_07707 [Labilithrix luteola]|uniref:Uncharacterized protein n=2 Tax=Labilithrix luteola TaxID=1391654 RepID=A0A0K1Q5N9_9BACT|nr:hypothetical protein AKJ09_07707 [Labilithrix luteola]
MATEMATKKAAAKGKDSAKPGKNGAKAGGAAKEKAGEPKRKLGLRGAAPWAARHAAKHAAEARARAAEPPLPGSARATIRTPVAAEDIKARIAELHNALQQIKGFRKNLSKGFFDVGLILKEIQAKKLYEAKGFGTFEAFLEREATELGKTQALRFVRMVGLFQKEGALELGMERVVMAMMSIEAGDGVPEARASGKIPPPPLSSSVLPLKPPGR